MDINKKLKNLLCKTLLLCLGWFFVALITSTMTYLNAIQLNYSRPSRIADILLYETICISPWVINTLLIIWITRKYRFESVTVYKSLAVHSLAMILVFAIHSIVQSYATSVFYDPTFTWAYIKWDLIRFLDMRLLMYFGVILGIYAVDFQRKNRDSQMREPRLIAQLNKAKYQSFLNQIQPAFLFSSIEAIRQNIRSNPHTSEEILIDFSALLRIMLQYTAKEALTLQENLGSYYLYTSLLKKRQGETIHIETDICDGCYEALVPSFLILIPVFEAMISFEGSGVGINSIRYSAMRKEDMMHLKILIKGEQKSKERWTKPLHQIGFTDIRQRLKNIYTEPITLEANVYRDGILIHMHMPYKIQPQKSLTEIHTEKEGNNYIIRD